MLNFRNTKLLFLMIMMFMLIGYAMRPFPLWFFVIPILGSIGTIAYGCYNIQAGYFLPVQCHGDASERAMALTFDDGPSPDHTPQILDILKEEGVKATFFCIGQNIPGNEMLLRRIHEEGHTIGNHSDAHHFYFDFFSLQKMKADLKSFDERIQSLLKFKPNMFRPPYGVTNPTVKKVIFQGNYLPVGWNIRSMDTVIQDPVRLKERVTTRFSPGAVILLHDTGQATASVLPEIIREAKRQGYSWVTVNQLFNIKPYA